MAESDAPRANPHLKDLAFLVGDWEMELSNAANLLNLLASPMDRCSQGRRGL